MKFKVMTFNIHHGKGLDYKVNLNRIARVIEESGANLIGLNEVDRRFSKRSAYMDQVNMLAQHLHMHQAFGVATTLKSRKTNVPRQYGNAFLSHFPINQHKNHPFHFYSRLSEGRSLLEIDLKILQQPLKIFVTHLSLNPILHRKQTDYIIKKIIDEPRPVIVMGDWNMRPKANAWNKITEHLTDVCRTTRNHHFYTYPSLRPRLQLDYIFVSRHFHIASVEVMNKTPEASDHLPLIATLSLLSNHEVKRNS